MKTAFQATRLAIAAFLIPYIFAMNPAMLFIDTNAIGVIQVIVTSIIGIVGVAAGLEGYLMRNMNAIERILIAAGGLLMLIPGTVTDLVGIIIIVALGGMQMAQKKKAAA